MFLFSELIKKAQYVPIIFHIGSKFKSNFHILPISRGKWDVSLPPPVKIDFFWKM